MLANKLGERFGRPWHFLMGPTAEQISEAERILSGREYYHLYDDVYREVGFAGGSQEKEFENTKIRSLVYHDFSKIQDDGVLSGLEKDLIDLGCGEGHNAIHFAQLGFRVTGVDISQRAIDTAAHLAKEKGLQINFCAADVLELAEFADDSFDLATDIGCLHMLVREEHRRRYLESVRRVLRPGGVFFLFNRVSSRDVRISDENAHILRSITLVQKRWKANNSSYLKVRGCGFRNASMRQYRRELEARGFDLVRTYRGDGEHRPFGTIVARVG
jgi:ubiquinone/menaquinone biosynthesis C-methylase UbiE